MTDTYTARAPLGVGALISGSFGLFFRRLPLFMAIAFVPTLIANAIAYTYQPDMFTVAPGQFEVSYEGWPVILNLAVVFIVSCLLTMAAFDVQAGRPVRVGHYLQRTLTRAWVLILLAILFYAMLALGLVLLILPGLYIGARFGLFTPAVLIDDAGFRALGRSSELTRDYRWALVGANVLIILAVSLIGFGLMPVLYFALPDAGWVILGIYGWVMLPIYSVINAFSYAILALFVALAYARLRAIKEGLGFDDLAEAFS